MGFNNASIVGEAEAELFPAPLVGGDDKFRFSRSPMNGLSPLNDDVRAPCWLISAVGRGGFRTGHAPLESGMGIGAASGDIGGTTSGVADLDVVRSITFVPDGIVVIGFE
jgi:hypothetical protein